MTYDRVRLQLSLNILSGEVSSVDNLSNQELGALGYDPHRWSGVKPTDLRHRAGRYVFECLDSLFDQIEELNAKLEKQNCSG